MPRTIFRPGKKYRVKSDFTKYGDDFSAGEILVFVNGTYSPYDNCDVYEFRCQDGSTKSWWLHQDEPAKQWKTYFKPVGFFG